MNSNRNVTIHCVHLFKFSEIDINPNPDSYWPSMRLLLVVKSWFTEDIGISVCNTSYAFENENYLILVPIYHKEANIFFFYFILFS